MKKVWLLLFLPLLVHAKFRPWGVASGGGGGGTNNVALVTGQFGGTNTNNSGAVDYAFDVSHPVTAGNTVLVGCALFGNSHSWAAGDCVKIAGTATIGTIVLDSSSNPVSTTATGVAIFRVPITGSGTLTIEVGGEASDYFVVGCAEFTGLNASPLDSGSVATGTGTAHSTGSLTTTAPGVIFYVGTELAATDFTRTNSDTLVFSTNTAASTYTGVIQFKLITTSPNTLTDSTGTDSSDWKVAYAKYKTS